MRKDEQTAMKHSKWSLLVALVLACLLLPVFSQTMWTDAYATEGDTSSSDGNEGAPADVPTDSGTNSSSMTTIPSEDTAQQESQTSTSETSTSTQTRENTSTSPWLGLTDNSVPDNGSDSTNTNTNTN
ncbi:MAG: hypothetical protein IKQ41_01380, partial [Clostridia bacterium]|nr:hypothetical protein [Clostridia bacterium]